MPIKISTFLGEQACTSPFLLEDAYAEIAINCSFERGMLESLRGPVRVYGLPAAGDNPNVYQTIFKHSTDGWIYYDDVVHLCKSDLHVADNRSAYGALFLTDWKNAVFGSIPVQRLRGDRVYKLAIPRPTVPITATSTGGETEEESSDSSSSSQTIIGTGTYIDGQIVLDSETTTTSKSTTTNIERSCVYVYTFVRKLEDGVIEQESATSPPSNVVDVLEGQHVSLTGMFATGGYNITHFRIYRSVSGTILGSNEVEYQFVAEIPATQGLYEDKTRDDELTGELCRTMNWDPIPDDAHGIIKTDNGIYVCFRGNEVLFSPHFIPYAFPEEYRVNVEDNVVALSHTDEAIVILTEGRPYLAVGSEPESLQIVRLPIDQACVSARGVVAIPGGVIYPSPDGLMFIAPNKQELLTQSLFTRQQWQNFDFPWLLDALTNEVWTEGGKQVNKFSQQLALMKPRNLIATWHDEKYYAFICGTPIGFIFDPKDKYIVWFILPMYYEVYGILNHVEDDCIYISARYKQYNNVYKLEAGVRLKYRWKSKRFNLGALFLMTTVQTFSEYEHDYDDEQLMKDQAAYANLIGYVSEDGTVGAGEWNAERVLKYMCGDKGLTIDEWYRRYGTISTKKQSYTVRIYAGDCSPEATPKCALKVKEDKSRRIPLKRAERVYSIEIEGKTPIHEVRLGTGVNEIES